MDENGFQVAERKKKVGAPPVASVRVYLGGLPVRDNLHSDLLSWLRQTVPEHITIGSIEIKQGGGGGGGRGKKDSSSCFALIDCGPHTNDVVRVLQQRNSFEGNKLTVQREQRAGSNSQKGVDKKRAFQYRDGAGRGGGRGRSSNFGNTFNNMSWSKPTDPATFQNGRSENPQGKTETECALPLTLEETSSRLAAIVSNEIEQAGGDADHVMNAALASTAAVTLLASLMTATDFALDDERDSTVNGASPTKLQCTIEPNNPAAEESNFAAFAKGQDLSSLLADFGEADPEWKNVDAPCSPSSPPPSNRQYPASSTERALPAASKFESRLAPHGKAPIHISLESFGYVHGAPSRRSQDSSWSPYTQPLAPIDCRTLFEPAPSYLDFHDGLRSGQVKRVLLQQSRVGGDSNSEREGRIDRPYYRDIQDYAKRILARREIREALLEAQNVGGHGYVSPLQMRVLVGSHLGRHRSVVVAEWAAIELRNVLRRNEGNAILHPVSVGTLHRDIEKRIPTRKYKEDEDDDRIQ
jgi:hypothetical protein